MGASIGAAEPLFFCRPVPSLISRTSGGSSVGGANTPFMMRPMPRGDAGKPDLDARGMMSRFPSPLFDRDRIPRSGGQASGAGSVIKLYLSGEGIGGFGSWARIFPLGEPILRCSGLIFVKIRVNSWFRIHNRDY